MLLLGKYLKGDKNQSGSKKMAFPGLSFGIVG